MTTYEIGDDLIILQDMDTDDDMDTPKKLQNDLISKMKKNMKFNLKIKIQRCSL